MSKFRFYPWILYCELPVPGIGRYGKSLISVFASFEFSLAFIVFSVSLVYLIFTLGFIAAFHNFIGSVS